jgi:hypothetical protein
VTAEQSVQEIVAEPVLRRGRLPEVYDPNPAYDRYALVEYAVDDIGAEFTATVSAEDDGSEYEVHCTLGKTEQIVILDEDYNVIYDRTGSMGDRTKATTNPKDSRHRTHRTPAQTRASRPPRRRTTQANEASPEGGHATLTG